MRFRAGSGEDVIGAEVGREVAPEGVRSGGCRRAEVGLDAAPGASATHPTPPNRSVLPLAHPIEASFARPDLNAPTSVSISASVIGVENTHAPELMMLQPSL